jgi:hypothetical protein
MNESGETGRAFLRQERTVRVKEEFLHTQVLDSIVVSIPACHAGDRGSIPRLGEETFLPLFTQTQLFSGIRIISILSYSFLTLKISQMIRDRTTE